MRQTAKRMNWPAALLAAALAAVIGYQAWAVRPAPPTAPATVAIVDLEELFEGLTVLEAGRAKLEEQGREYEAETKSREEEIELLQQDLELHPQGSPQWEELYRQIMRKSFELNAYLEFARGKINAKQAELLADVYRLIKDDVARYSEQNGIDIVLMDDSRDLRDVPNRDEMMRQISARRMLYGDDQLDITRDLIEFMNP